MTTIENDAAAPTTGADDLVARPIPTAYLDEVFDDLGNPVQVAAAVDDGEPLRCCLRHARAGEAITLISQRPGGHGVWREVGPVYVHAGSCPGPTSTFLPKSCVPGLGCFAPTGPTGSMNYGQNTLVSGDEDLEGALRRLLHDPDVSHVHVRTVLPPCIIYSVTIRRLSTTERNSPGSGALI